MRCGTKTVRDFAEVLVKDNVQVKPCQKCNEGGLQSTRDDECLLAVSQ